MLETGLVRTAAILAKIAHMGQTRAHGEPYIVHPGRVAARCSLIPELNNEVIAACWLHDVIEDVKGFDTLSLFTSLDNHARGVLTLMLELTNVTHSQGTPRDEKKRRDRERLKHVSWQAKCIKLADRIDNMRDCVFHAKEMAISRPKMFFSYAAESELLLEYSLLQTNGELEDEYRLWLSRLYSATDAFRYLKQSEKGTDNP